MPKCTTTGLPSSKNKHRRWTPKAGQNEEAKTTSYDPSKKEVLPEGSIGLDSLSTVDLFWDARMLTGIRRAPSSMKIQCNAGFKEVSHTGRLAGYASVWFEPCAVANILSLGRVTKRFKVTFDSDGSDGFVLHQPGGRKKCVRKTTRGLYATQFLIRRNQNHEMSLTIAKVEGNKAHFTKREVKQAERARGLQTTLIFQSNRYLEKITGPVIFQAVFNARTIFGP